jgi:pantoate--beta-alanine ligase
MQILRDIASAREFIRAQKRGSKSIGLVPTMGALHQGHLSLVSRCAAENDVAVASIFVNPIQFNNPGDLAKYPRTLERDVELLTSAECSAVFCPSSEEMYNTQPLISISFGALDKILEGEFRPGHFSGVGIVVAKLFNILQPDAAYFGQKDYQQFLIVQQLVHDLSFPLNLVCADIVREPDGLAMSSRNQRLSPEQRKQAAMLFQVLSETKAHLGKRPLSQLKSEATQKLSTVGIRLEYLELAARENLSILLEYNSDIASLLLIAAFVGEVRLIDNLFV